MMPPLSSHRIPSLLLACLFPLGGCATSENYVSNVDYEEFYDASGEHKLVRRNNDIWMENLDGSESRQLTNTPAVKEWIAEFILEGRYVLYSTTEGRTEHFRYFIATVSGGDVKTREVDKEEWGHLSREETRKSNPTVNVRNLSGP